MLGQSQIAPIQLPRTPRGWYPNRPGHLGPLPSSAQSADEAELKREELINSFRQSTSFASDLDRKGLSGKVLAFKPRQLAQTSQPRSRELAWRRTHEPELRALEGQWVVVEGERMVANAANAAEVVAQARAQGIKVPYIFFVEPIRPKTARLGL